MEFSSEWLTKLIRDEIVKKLFGVALSLAAFLALWLVVNQFGSLTVLEKTLIAVVFFTCCSWAGAVARRRWARSTYWYPRVKFAYEVLDKKIYYEIDSTGGLRYTRTVKIKSRLDCLDSFDDKFLWTGPNPTFPLPGDGCAAVRPKDVRGIWIFFTVQLEHSLNRGDETEVTICWPTLTDWRNASEFVSASTEEPTRRLAFHVILTNAQVDGRGYWEVTRSIESPFSLQSGQFSVDGKLETSDLRVDNGRIHWTVKRPKLYRHYRLRWSWPGHAQAEAMPSGTDAHTAN